jgi:hypothetical protein
MTSGLRCRTAPMIWRAARSASIEASKRQAGCYLGRGLCYFQLGIGEGLVAAAEQVQGAGNR